MTKIKKTKGTNKAVIKKLKIQNYKNCLEPAQNKSKINQLQTNKIHENCLQDFVKNNKVIMKRFKSERHNVFTDEINNIALSSNDDKRMQ